MKVQRTSRLSAWMCRILAWLLCLNMLATSFGGDWFVQAAGEEQGVLPVSDDDDSGEESDPDTPTQRIDLPSKAEVQALVDQYADDNDGAAYCFSGGSGTQADPYLIATANDLAVLAAMINYQVGIAGYETGFKGVYFRQTQDIDLGEYNEWIPIGIGSVNSGGISWQESTDDPLAFQGIYNGGNHIISRMTINIYSLWMMLTDSSSDHYADFAIHPDVGDDGYLAVGLFGRITAAGKSADTPAVDNLTLQNASVSFGDSYTAVGAGHIYVGGVVGSAQAGLSEVLVRGLQMVARDMLSTGLKAIRLYGALVGEMNQPTAAATQCMVADSTININSVGDEAEQLFVGGLVGGMSNVWNGASSGAVRLVDNFVVDSDFQVTNKTQELVCIDTLAGLLLDDGQTLCHYDDQMQGTPYISNLDEVATNIVIGCTTINKDGNGNEVELPNDDRAYDYNKLGFSTVTVEQLDGAVPGAYTLQAVVSNPRTGTALLQSADYQLSWQEETEDDASLAGQDLTAASVTLDPAPYERQIALSLQYLWDDGRVSDDPFLVESLTIPAFTPTLTLVYGTRTDYDGKGGDLSTYQAVLSTADIPAEQQQTLELSRRWYLNGTLLEETGDTYGYSFTSHQTDTLTCELEFTYYGHVYTLTQETVLGITIYVDNSKGNDNYTDEVAGSRENPVKTLARAFELLELRNPGGSREQNTIVILGSYTTNYASSQYGRVAFEPSLCVQTIFPELLQGHTPPYLTSTAQITAATDTQAMLKEMVEGNHVNATIRGMTAQDVISDDEEITPSVICIRVNSSGTDDRSILQYSDLAFDDITLKFCRNNDVNTTQNANNRITWYCNGYDLTMGEGVKIAGLSSVTAKINNGILTAAMEISTWKGNAPDLSFVATSFTSMPIAAALGKFTVNGQDYYCLDSTKLGNTLHISGGNYARIMGGGRSGDTFLSTMAVWDAETEQLVYPYSRLWLYGTTVSSTRQGDMRYLWNNQIIVDGVAVAALVTGGQADSIAMVNAHVTVGGQAKVALVVGGSIGYGTNNNKSRYPAIYDSNGKLLSGTQNTLIYANDFKGNTQVTVQENAYIYALYGGSLGRNNNTGTSPTCAMRGETITVNITGGEISTVYGGGAGATIGTNLVENRYRGGTAYITANVSCDIELNISGGLIKNSLYGGSDGYYEWAQSLINPLAGNIYGDVTVNISGGEILDNVYGGSKGVDISRLSDNVYSLYKGKTNLAQITGTCVLNITGGTFGGSIYGGSAGVLDTPDMAKIIGETVVVVDGDVSIPYNVYGGGENGEITGVAGSSEYYGSSHVFLTSGTIAGSVYGGGRYGSVLTLDQESYRGTMVMMIGGEVQGNIFGGGLSADVDGYSKVVILGGEVLKPVFGGNNQSGAVTCGTFVYVASRKDEEGTLYSPLLHASLFGGGLGYATSVGQSDDLDSGVLVRLGDRTNTENPTEAEIKAAGMVGEQVSDYLLNRMGNQLIAAAGTRFSSLGLAKYGELLLLLPTEGGDVQADDNNQFTIYNRVYGGGELGLVSHTLVLLYGGTVTASPGAYQGSVVPSIFGGGYGGLVSADMSGLNQFYAANVEITSVIVGENFAFEGNIYGGGELSSVGLDNAAIEKQQEKPITNATDGYVTHVTIRDNAQIQGRVFGGSMGEIDAGYGHIFGCTDVELTGNSYVKEIYGGGYAAGADSSQITTTGGEVEVVYGGGRYGDVGTATIDALSNTEIRGNLYGGCCQGGTVQSTVLNIGGHDINESEHVHLHGSVFGAGYGVDTVTMSTYVQICLAVTGEAISYNAEDEVIYYVSAENPDFSITECPSAPDINDVEKYGDVQSGSTILTFEWSKENRTTSSDKYDTHSFIMGSVYGGGDMGQVGIGTVASSQTSAVITEPGTTHVAIHNGYILGSVFGGGSGQAPDGERRTAAMGVVFGFCNTHIHNALINGDVFGGGDQSLVFAADSGEHRGEATYLLLKEAEDDTLGQMVVVRGSVYGGGNVAKGSVHASVYTVFGSTQIDILGLPDQERSTMIFLFGGVYGDGNICLVSGRRTVNITDFNYDDTSPTLFKTFYSLQRADEINLTRTRIVLLGAKDLVDVSASNELYAINRVSQLNMNESSAVKLSSIVNYLGGLASDQNAETVYIDRGNNSKNDYTVRGGVSHEDDAINNVVGNEKIQEYLNAFVYYQTNHTPNPSSPYQSFNQICVANGRYLEIKKDDSTYGNVTGLFALQLLYAVAGEGGGFVYANIGSTGEGNEFSGSTGDFICCTPKSNTYISLNNSREEYMVVEDDCGGYSMSNTTPDGEKGDYSYYYWYIVGLSYRRYVYLQGYIGSASTAYPYDVPLMDSQVGSRYVLKDIVVTENSSQSMTDLLNERTLFNSSQFISEWDDDKILDGESKPLSRSDHYAIELQMVINDDATQAQSIGYLSYDSENQQWGIVLADGTTIYGSGDDVTDGDLRLENLLYTITRDEGVKSLSMRFVLHKGSEVYTELEDVPLTVEIYCYEPSTTTGETDYTEPTILNFTIYTSITRLTSRQEIEIIAGRSYIPFIGDNVVSITHHSSFTAEITTDYIPANYQNVRRYFTFSGDDRLYLMDEVNGVSFAVDSDGQLVYASQGSTTSFTVVEEDGRYQITYGEGSGIAEGTVSAWLTTSTVQSAASQLTLPVGTTITLVATINEGNPTYWYYYCEEETDPDGIPLSAFVRMNQSKDSGQTFSLAAASGGAVSDTSDFGVTEDLLFVVDFSGVSNDDWVQVVTDSVDEDATWQMRVKYLYTTAGGFEDADIMDYVQATYSVESQSTETWTEETEASRTSAVTVVTYEHNLPTLGSSEVRVSPTADGLQAEDSAAGTTAFAFAAEPSDVTGYTVNCVLNGTVTVTEDISYTNTQIFTGYDGRHYAVRISLQESGTEVTFPKGAVILFDDQQIGVGVDGLSFAIPIEEAGTHHFQLDLSNSTGLDAGKDYTLVATLYSAPVTEFYHDIGPLREATVSFTTQPAATHALQVSGSSQVIGQGGKLTVSVTVSTNTVTDSEILSVHLYRYRGAALYESYDRSRVFSESDSTEFELPSLTANTRTTVTWSGTLNKVVPVGTYRMEFVYHDRVEYWDFIVID